MSDEDKKPEDSTESPVENAAKSEADASAADEAATSEPKTEKTKVAETAAESDAGNADDSEATGSDSDAAEAEDTDESKKDGGDSEKAEDSESESEPTVKELAIRFSVVLFIIAALSGFLLSVVYLITKSKIAALEKASIAEGLQIVLPFENCAIQSGDTPSSPWKGKIVRKDKNGKDEPVGEIVAVGQNDKGRDDVWKVTDTSGNVKGWIALASQSGYSSEVPVIVGVYRSNKGVWKLTGIKVLNTAETPGLGENVHAVPPRNSWGGILTGAESKPLERPKFQQQFKDVDFAPFLKLDAKKICADESVGIDAMSGATITSHAVINAVRKAAKKIKAQMK